MTHHISHDIPHDTPHDSPHVPSVYFITILVTHKNNHILSTYFIPFDMPCMNLSIGTQGCGTIKVDVFSTLEETREEVRK